MTSLLEMEQSMLDDLLIQDEGSLPGQERIQMDPLQEVYLNWILYYIHGFIFDICSMHSMIIFV